MSPPLWFAALTVVLFLVAAGFVLLDERWLRNAPCRMVSARVTEVLPPRQCTMYAAAVGHRLRLAYEDRGRRRTALRPVPGGPGGSLREGSTVILTIRGARLRQVWVTGESRPDEGPWSLCGSLATMLALWSLLFTLLTAGQLLL